MIKTQTSYLNSVFLLPPVPCIFFLHHNKGIKRQDNLLIVKKFCGSFSVEINSIDLNKAVYAYFRKPGTYYKNQTLQNVGLPPVKQSSILIHFSSLKYTENIYLMSATNQNYKPNTFHQTELIVTYNVLAPVTLPFFKHWMN